MGSSPRRGVVIASRFARKRAAPCPSPKFSFARRLNAEQRNVLIARLAEISLGVLAAIEYGDSK